MAEKEVLWAEADLKASTKRAESKKILADATAEEEAASGISEVRVMKAKSEAIEMQGVAEANVMKAKSEAVEVQGVAEAKVIKEKGAAEAEGITKKAEAMKKLDSVGKEHEEFKLRLNKDKEVELAKINVSGDVARSQAEIIKEGLKSAKIDIVGGESMFFDKLINSITMAKQIDSVVGKSEVVSDVRDMFLKGDSTSAENFKRKLRGMASHFNINTEDFKNMTISAAILYVMGKAGKGEKKFLEGILDEARNAGMDGESVSSLMN